MARVASRLRNQSVISSMNRWIEYTDERQYQRRLVKKTLGRLCNNKISSAFQSWVEDVKTMRHMESLMARVASRLRNQSVISSMNRWIEYTEERQYQRRLVKKTLGRLCNNKISSAFQSWVFKLKTREADEKLMRSITKRMLNTKLISAWKAWMHRAIQLSTEEPYIKLLTERDKLVKQHEEIMRIKMKKSKNEAARRIEMYANAMVEVSHKARKYQIVNQSFSRWRVLTNFSFITRTRGTVNELERKLHVCQMGLFSQKQQLESQNKIQLQAMTKLFQETETRYLNKSSVDDSYHFAHKKLNGAAKRIRKFEPMKYSMRDVHLWEKQSGKKWHLLNSRERAKANEEIGAYKHLQKVAVDSNSIHHRLQRVYDDVPFILGGKNSSDSTNSIAKLQYSIGEIFNDPRKAASMESIMRRAKMHAKEVLEAVHQDQQQEFRSREAPPKGFCDDLSSSGLMLTPRRSPPHRSPPQVMDKERSGYSSFMQLEDTLKRLLGVLGEYSNIHPTHGDAALSPLRSEHRYEPMFHGRAWHS